MIKIRVAIHGAAGRMGQRLVALASADPGLSVVGALESAAHPKLGEDAGVLAGIGPIGIPLSSELPELCDVVIDFSVPEASLALAEKCSRRALPLVLATTGFEAHQRSQMLAFAHLIPLLWSPNTSLAVNLLMKLTAVAGKSLKDHAGGVDVEIIERHHRMKEDSPSGTAIKFGEIIAESMGKTKHQHGRHGRIGKKPLDEIGYHGVRTGDNPGEHTIIFGMPGETIELVVRASNRDSYAHGALAAAKYMAGKKPGTYSMDDVLGL